ncbi:MAG: 30S ribosomal protein S17 [Candidatus Aminicenantaceae bacterium]
MKDKQKARKNFKVGVVTGNHMKKTVTVEVERLVRHPLYKKTIKRKKKYLAHDEYEKCKIGDKVRLVQTRPLSKNKRWRVYGLIDLTPADKERFSEEKK